MNIFFDIIIFGFLLVDIPLIFWLISKQPKLSSVKKKSILGLAILAWGIIFYGSFIEPQKIVIQHESISFGESNSIQVAILSDLHVGPYKSEAYIQKVVETVLQENPDYVFLLGDYVYGNLDEVQKLSPLKQLTEIIPTYGIMGNHDYDLAGAQDDIDDELGTIIRKELNNLGVILMEDESRPIDKDKLWITGLQEIWTNRSNLDRALSNRPPNDAATILLAHNPDIVQDITAEQNIDLVLSGHTHGGQIRLPLLGPIGPIPTELGQRYDQGFFDFATTKLFISSGLGESGPRARLFNPPEIVLLTIQY